MKLGIIKVIMTVAAAATFAFNPAIKTESPKGEIKDTVQYRAVTDPGGTAG